MEYINLKKFAWFFILLMISPLIAIYFGTINVTAIWLYAFFILFIWFAFSKQDDFIRALVLICFSVLIAVLGELYLDGKEDKAVIDVIKNLMLIVPSCIGGSLMSSAFSNNRK